MAFYILPGFLGSGQVYGPVFRRLTVADAGFIVWKLFWF